MPQISNSNWSDWTMTTAPETKSHSRQPKGECGERLGKKLDKLIAEVQHEACCESACCGPVAVLEKPEPSTVDPPVPVPGGGTERALVEPAVGGNGFPNPSPLVDEAAWMVAIEADDNDPVGDIAHLEFLIQNNRAAEGAMRFQTLSRLREVLATQITRSSSADTPVTITAMDAVLLSRLLLQRL